MKTELKGAGYPYFNQQNGIFVYKTKADIDRNEKIFDIYIKQGVKIKRINSHEELLKVEPFMKPQRTNRLVRFYFRCILV